MVDIGKQVEWYKRMNLYVVYADAFRNGKRGDFFSLAKNLEYIKETGFDAIHVLPFLESPMQDAGFDVSDFFRVRKRLGGNEGFEVFLREVGRLKMKVFMDLVVNHVSMEHEWFKKAVSGDEYYRNFFIHTPVQPKLIEVEDDRWGKWARYRLNRRELRSRIIFLNQNGELPHWFRGDDGFWYYHTFYKHQIDLNWTNPEVVKAFGEVISFWGGKGLSFRIDAAPFAGKNLSNIREGQMGSHKVVRELRRMVKEVNKDGVLLIEACQPMYKMKKYFGSDEQPEAEMAYNFELMRGLWATIVSGKGSYIWKALRRTRDIPSHAGWVSFLRNHDELSLEYAQPKVRRLVYDSLVKNGVEFRGEYGLAGRTASFLKKDPRKIVLAHFLLASVNGACAVVYGDEVGKVTNRRYIRIDARDGNRGWLTETELGSKKAKLVRDELSKIFTTRLKHPELAVVKPVRSNRGRRNWLSLRYGGEGREIEVLVNLSRKKRVVSMDENKKLVLSINGAERKEDKIVLPAYSGVWLVGKE